MPEERASPALAGNTKMESEPVGICQPLVSYASARLERVNW